MEATEKKHERPAKERLLDAAMDVFGQDGYEGATTRMIARKAGVNIAAIPYYFGGKEGLYKALLEQVVSMVRTQVELVMQEIAVADFSSEDGPEKAKLLVEKMLEKIILFMVGSDHAPRISRIILREQLFPSAAYDLIFKGFMEAILNSLADLLQVISPGKGKKEATLQAMALTGQVLIFRVARETAIRALDMEGYSREEMKQIREVILSQTRDILDAAHCGVSKER